MQRSSSLLQPPKDGLAHFFDHSGMHGNGHYSNSASEMAHQDGAASTSRNGGSMSMNNSISVNTNHTSNGGSSANPNPMFTPSSPMQPSSPNSQMTMQLLGNLMQMQGLDGGFSLPSSAVPVTSNPGSTDSTSFGMGSSFNMQPSSSNNQSRNNHSSPNNFLGSPGQALTPNAILEQQIKLQQLQQLYQLQNQIFQQQMALISGNSPSLSKGSSQEMGQHFHNQDDSHNPPYTGLPTPGPSTELRPQQQSMEFVSPMILNNYNIESDPHSHSHTPSPMITSTYRDDTFSQQLPPPMAPQASMDFGPSSHLHHHNLHRGIASAPEHLAFDIRSGREFDLDVSPLTSPWLGAYGEAAPSSSSRMRMAAHRKTSMSHTSVIEEDERMANGNKRTASPATDELSSRKKHSPAIGPTLSGAGMFSSQASRRQGGSSQTASGHRTSKSTTSTPLLKGSRNRSKSGVGSGVPITTQGQPADGSSEPPPQHKMFVGHVGAIPEDSPSPVDLSVPPSSEQLEMMNSDGGGTDLFQSAGSAARLMPVTPASIMNLGRLGIATSSADGGAGGSSGTSSSNATPTPTTTATTPTTGRGSRSRNKPDGSTKALKTILPAGDPNPKPSTMSKEDNLPPGQKKTSHKAAEQKRRDSLKTTFDDLRKLLPPIAFEDTIEEEGGSGSGSTTNNNPKPKGKDKVLPVRGPLLPGALPPRGPPKVGGDGPNKGVSKLQLLVCGNQYIRTLKGRVERRDEEIAKLRREVLRLRRRAGGLEGGSGGEMQVDAGSDQEDDEDLDLERDLDAIEGMTVKIGLVEGAGDEDDYEDM